MAVWYYSQNGQSVGPLEEPQILTLAEQGKIKREDLVWREGMPEWINAAAAGLFKNGPAATPATASPSAASGATALPDYAKWIEESRGLIGKPPRTLVGSPYLRITPPPWLQKTPYDPLWEVYRQQEVLYREGFVVWSCVMKANQRALSPGPDDVPASVVYSPHPWFDGRLDQLGRIAQVVGELKGKPAKDPEAAEFVRAVFDEQNRAPRLPVPKSIFNEYPSFHTTIVVIRKHLPHGFLTNGMLPILVKPQTTTAAIVLPSCYWAPELLAAWERGFQQIITRVNAARRAAASGQQIPRQ
jgi:hypothetical protein